MKATLIPPRKNTAALILALVSCAFLEAAPGDVRLTLKRLVTPTTVYLKDGQPVPFAIHAFIEFQTLQEFFGYVDDQAGKWTFETDEARVEFAGRLLRRGVESRLVSMVYEKPLEVLLTHTVEEIKRSVESLGTNTGATIYRGKHWQLNPEEYIEKLLAVQERWRTSLNCWSASPSIAGRVLSNWYLIDEGIELFGATYDSTEHFWQAVKYHPSVRIRDINRLLDRLEDVDWSKWIGQLSNDQEMYFRHGYAIEFLRSNLKAEHRAWFREELQLHGLRPEDSARVVQQRDQDQPERFRFSALQEKVLWGDIADVFHLIYCFSNLDGGRFQVPEMRRLMEELLQMNFDGVYLEGYRDGKVGFLSREFQLLMPEIWKTKYLQMDRFGDVIRSTGGMKLDHFLNDGDSPDIPITVYVGFLEQIRDEALKQLQH